MWGSRVLGSDNRVTVVLDLTKAAYFDQVKQRNTLPHSAFGCYIIRPRQHWLKLNLTTLVQSRTMAWQLADMSSLGASRSLPAPALLAPCRATSHSRSSSRRLAMQHHTEAGRSDTFKSSAVSGAAPATAPPAAGQEAVSHVPSEAARKMLFGVAQEQECEVEGTVHGTLPAWLSGSLIVNGGGDYSHMNHMFDGYALLTKVRVEGGKAFGSQRYLDTNVYRAYKKEGRVVMREFATRAEVSGPLGELTELLKQLWGLMTKNPSFTDNASVSLQAVGPAAATGRGSKLLAMSETPVASYIVDPNDLSTLEQVQYSDAVPGDLTTAHPTVLSDGTLVNFSRTLPLGGFHVYKQDPETLARTQVAYVPDRQPLSPAWLHDFAATDKYAVLMEQPLYMSLASLLLGTPASHLFMNWQPQDEVRVHVVSLDGSGVVRSFSCPTFFFFHIGNAFETDDGRHLCVDFAAYDDPQILLDLSIQPLVSPAVNASGEVQQVSRSYYKRLTIPLTAGASDRLQAPQFLVPSASSTSGSQDPLGGFCEFPGISPAYRGKPYRYAYSLSAVRPTNMGNALSKMDLQAGAAETWHEPGGAVGEPVFVARPGATTEDDGVVLAPGVDASGFTFMLVMDAASWTELARVQFPFGTPYRFHGIWLQS